MATVADQSSGESRHHQQLEQQQQSYYKLVLDFAASRTADSLYLLPNTSTHPSSPFPPSAYSNISVPSSHYQTSSVAGGVANDTSLLATLSNDSLLDYEMTTAEGSGELVPCGLFFFFVYGPFFCLVCLVGLIGNALSFLVLHKYSRDSVATFLLKALAVSDNMFLATAFFVQVYPAMWMYFGLVAQLKPVYPYLQTYAWPVAHMVQMGSVYMMVLVAANRYIAVCKPLHAPRLCTKRNVYLQILFMSTAILVYNLPRFFEYRYVVANVTLSDASDYSNATADTVLTTINVGLVKYTIYNILYENISYMIFVFLIPLLVLVIFNAHLVYELRRARENRKSISSGKSREENNITLVMIVIILIFIACQTPASINQVLYYTIGQAQGDQGAQTCTNYERYYHLSNLFITMNSATNFFVYCLFRRQFQHELLALFCCLRWRSGGRGSGGARGVGGRGAGGHRPLRRTLLLRALHQHSSFSATTGGGSVGAATKSGSGGGKCSVSTRSSSGSCSPPAPDPCTEYTSVREPSPPSVTRANGHRTNGSHSGRSSVQTSARSSVRSSGRGGSIRNGKCTVLYNDGYVQLNGKA